MILGPHMWKIKFPMSLGHQQSPINIISDCAICVPAETNSILTFSPEYQKPAKDMRIYNDGHTGEQKSKCLAGKLCRLFRSLDLRDVGGKQQTQNMRWTPERDIHLLHADLQMGPHRHRRVGAHGGLLQVRYGSASSPRESRGELCHAQ